MDWRGVCCVGCGVVMEGCCLFVCVSVCVCGACVWCVCVVWVCGVGVWCVCVVYVCGVGYVCVGHVCGVCGRGVWAVCVGGVCERLVWAWWGASLRGWCGAWVCGFGYGWWLWGLGRGVRGAVCLRRGGV